MGFELLAWVEFLPNHSVDEPITTVPQETPFRIRDDGLLIFVRVTPRSSRESVDGTRSAAGGQCHVSVRVTVPPDKGAANKAVLSVLAKALGVPKSALTIVSGETSRSKSILVHGAGNEWAARLTAYLEDLP